MRVCTHTSCCAALARSLTRSFAACMARWFAGWMEAAGRQGQGEGALLWPRRQSAAAADWQRPITAASQSPRRTFFTQKVLLLVSSSSFYLCARLSRWHTHTHSSLAFITTCAASANYFGAKSRLCKLMALYGLVKCRPNWQLPLTCKKRLRFRVLKSEQMRVCV